MQLVTFVINTGKIWVHKGLSETLYKTKNDKVGCQVHVNKVILYGTSFDAISFHTELRIRKYFPRVEIKIELGNEFCLGSLICFSEKDDTNKVKKQEKSDFTLI